MKEFISVSEDAYKALISPETKDKFVNKTMTQLFLTDEQIVQKLKKYTLDEENKGFRILKPIYNVNKIGYENQVTGASLLIAIKDGVAIWN